MTMIKGNTYPVRRALAQMGGKWNATEKGWEVPDDLADEARRIVGPEPAPKPKARVARRYECPDCCEVVDSGTRCWETGLRH